MSPSLDSHSFTAVTDETFQVSIDTVDRVQPRRRYEHNNLGGGLVLNQYRVFSDYESLTISITYNRKHVAKSPYVVRNILHENCACPLRSVDQWLFDFKCPKMEVRIRDDLKVFKKDGVNISGLYERGGELFSRNSFIHYSIVGNKVWYVCVCCVCVCEREKYRTDNCLERNCHQTGGEGRWNWNSFVSEHFLINGMIISKMITGGHLDCGTSEL